MMLGFFLIGRINDSCVPFDEIRPLHEERLQPNNSGGPLPLAEPDHNHNINQNNECELKNIKIPSSPRRGS